MTRLPVQQLLLGILCGFAAITSSHATTITFDSVLNSVDNQQRTSLVTDGFTFTSEHFHTINNPAAATFGGDISSGSIFILEEGGGLGSPITMAMSGGGTFSLNSLFGSKVFVNGSAAATGGFPNADYLNILGYLSGGGTVSATFALGSSFQQFFLPSTFSSLSSVVFSGALVSGAAGGISLDTIVVNSASVPEGGSTVILLAVTLIGLGLARKRAGRFELALKPINRQRR